ncbi:hypothetical protein [Undibacterium sp.]|uniref:hypothetical protein n=1 Tax=Undibacterium sp. TaxID=1914977 RepID=UPI0027316DFD|nr:hypothetical protein [Undibacterium sp.]MDP1980553.1 hypothetical protein [Undibacterium sp.]
MTKKTPCISIALFAALICASLNTYASNSSPIIDCSTNGHAALKTADSYLIYLELGKRKLFGGDFEKYAVNNNNVFLSQIAKDDLNLLYEGKIRSPALFGALLFSKCMETSKTNIKWVNGQSVPMCFKNLEIANSIANAKRAGIPTSEVVADLRTIGQSKFIDNVMGLGKVNEIINVTYKTSNATEEINLQRTMIQQCLQSSKAP